MFLHQAKIKHGAYATIKVVYGKEYIKKNNVTGRTFTYTAKELQLMPIATVAYSQRKYTICSLKKGDLTHIVFFRGPSFFTNCLD